MKYRYTRKEIVKMLGHTTFFVLNPKKYQDICSFLLATKKTKKAKNKNKIKIDIEKLINTAEDMGIFLESIRVLSGERIDGKYPNVYEGSFGITMIEYGKKEKSKYCIACDNPNSKLIHTCDIKKAKNSGGVKSGKTTKKCMLCGLVFSLKSWKECPRCKTLPQPNIQPLNLAHTTTSRPELRQTEKEIMIENKINEIIKLLSK